MYRNYLVCTKWIGLTGGVVLVRIAFTSKFSFGNVKGEYRLGLTLKILR